MTETGAFQNNWERPNEKTINGIPVSRMHKLIEKNSDRYVGIFEKNEDKKVFANLNFAAMFFSIYWFFYRKMYLYGIIFLIAATALSFVSEVVVTAFFADDLASIAQEYTELEEKLKSGEISDQEVILPSKVKYNAYESKMKSLQLKTEAVMAKVGLISFVVTFIIRLVPGLFADCIYRHHLLTNGEKAGGGVSKKAVLIVIAVELVLGILI
ncbi:MAG: DUF2628 domain-containing protein [Ruminococcaceae bacterium]|nr:DUF2628 domain-containing protein [Oscillospiraceae bacterium]